MENNNVNITEKVQREYAIRLALELERAKLNLKNVKHKWGDKHRTKWWGKSPKQIAEQTKNAPQLYGENLLQYAEIKIENHRLEEELAEKKLHLAALMNDQKMLEEQVKNFAEAKAKKDFILMMKKQFSDNPEMELRYREYLRRGGEPLF